MTGGAPRIVMTLLVRDEADVLADMLDASFALGVDHVIATDHLSADGTSEILATEAERGRCTVIREEDPAYRQVEFVTRMARLAATDHGADWVINADADEIWWPEGGDLKACFASVPDDVDVVVAQRFNFLARDDGPPEWWRRMRWRYATSFNHEGVALPPKVAHRADPEAQIGMGNHEVHHPVRGELDDGRLTVLHFPMRSYVQFATKIVAGGEALEAHTELDPALGSAWRRMLDLHRAGRFEDEWRSWVPTDDELAAALADGSVVEDARVLDLLAGLRDDGARAQPDAAGRAGGAGRLRRLLRR